MIDQVALLRSVLYAPAHSTALFDAALRAQPDAVIVDLEDGVPADHKPLARLSIGHLVEQVRRAGAGVVVRVNATDTEWFHDDLAATLEAKPDAVLLPKGGAAELNELHNGLVGTPTPPAIWALVETVSDVLAVESTMALGLAAAVTIGYGDLCKELGLPLGSEHPEFVGVRKVVTAAANAHGVVALDGVFVGPSEKVPAACAASASFGFVGRTLYDPRHVGGCNPAFDTARHTTTKRP